LIETVGMVILLQMITSRVFWLKDFGL